MCRKSLAFTVLLFFVLLLRAQNISPLSLHHIEQLNSASSAFPVLVKGDAGVVSEAVSTCGAKVIRKYGDIWRIDVPASRASRFISMLGSSRWQDLAFTVTTLMDTARIVNNIDSIHSGASPLSTPYSGHGVIMGIIDDGIDFTHPDFKNADSSSRIRFLWDQNLAASAASPIPYNYGREWNWAEINGGFCIHREQGSAGHGSHVSGIAAGNGTVNPVYRGIAYNSDLVVVSCSYNSRFLSNVIDGIDYIFKKADGMGRPCVVNTSLGDYYGSHDGKDLVSEVLGFLLDERPGRVIVAAAGNAGNIPFHLGYDLTADTSFTWFSGIAYSSRLYLDFWSDTNRFANAYFNIAADDSGGLGKKGNSPFINIKRDFPTVFINGTASAYRNVVNDSGARIGQVQYFITLDGSRFHVEAEITPDTSKLWWKLSTYGSGRLDAWAEKNLTGSSDWVLTVPADSVLSDMIHYKAPDLNQTLVSSWQCSDQVITVGNYVNRESFLNYDSLYTENGYTPGALYFSSSLGPTRDGRIKPDITATGGTVISVGNIYWTGRLIATGQQYKVAYGGFYVRNSGTSMASPMVAGVAALYLERNPSATWREIREVIQRTARSDSFTTSALPNPSWGYGKLNGFAAMNYPAVLGCMDTGSINYDPAANIDNGSCVPKIYGCRDSLALNYNPLANISDTCVYSTVGVKPTISTENQVRLYPVPADDFVQVNIHCSVSAEPICFLICNSLGQELMRREVKQADENWNINVELFSAGVYFYSLERAGLQIEKGKFTIR